MSKQEEIREGVASVVRKHNIHKNAMELPGYQLLLRAFLDDILKCLHSQGVVIKVDIGGGYSDIESLIEE